MSALVDPLGTLLYVATKFAVKVQATKANGTFTIDRAVELTLEPVGRTWLVVAYRVTVTRAMSRMAASFMALFSRPNRTGDVKLSG